MEWLLSFRRFLPDVTIHAMIKKDVCAASYTGTTRDDSTKAAAATLARDKATPSPSTRVEPPVIPALQQTYSWGLGFHNSTLSKGYIFCLNLPVILQKLDQLCIIQQHGLGNWAVRFLLF